MCNLFLSYRLGKFGILSCTAVFFCGVYCIRLKNWTLLQQKSHKHKAKKFVQKLKDVDYHNKKKIGIFGAL